MPAPQVVYHGRTALLAQYFESAYRTPPVTPTAQLLKFSTLTIGQDADLQDDPTITPNALASKRDDNDSTATAQAQAILCLNDIGRWLTMLLGPSVTTGAGPYTHVFTLDLTERPSSILELSLGVGGDYRIHQFIGMVLNELSWDVMEAAQNFTANLIGAVEVKPQPTVLLDIAPDAQYLKSRACTKRGSVYDVLNNSTLGDISKCSISFKNDVTAYALADGQEGSGRILLGQPSVSGSLSALFTKGTIFDDGLQRLSKALVAKSASADGVNSMTVNIPNVEFDVPKVTINTAKGLVVENLAWRAHAAPGGNPVTITLVNAIPTYS